MAQEGAAAEQGTQTATPDETRPGARSEAAGGEEHAPVEAVSLDELFRRDELEQFDRDDVAAGSHIGKMLAFFFLYTVIVMSIVAWWTYNAVTE